jgi:hypothetical protein
VKKTTLEKIFSGATFFLDEAFVRITENEKGKVMNTYFNWERITSVTTIANVEK